MILVTGATGVLGMALLAQLAERGAAYTTISHSDTDLRDQEQVRRRFEEIRPEVVYHLAAKVHGIAGNGRFPYSMYTDNTRINTNVIDSAVAVGCKKIIAVSTVAVYSASAPLPVHESSVWDGSPHRSEEAYGHAKRGMLAQLESAQIQHGLSFAYPIMTNIYGPHDRFDVHNGHVVPSLIAKFYQGMLSNSIVSIWGSGIAKRDFIFSEDAARALVMIGDHFEGPINVATGETVQIRDLVQCLQSISNVSEVVWDSSKPDGQLERSYDVSHLRALGFRPNQSLKSGVEETFSWYSKAYPAVRV